MANFPIGSERDYFSIYWSTEQFADGARYVFSDELADYIFFPYTGKLKEIPGYCENREEFEDSRIFMVNNATGKLLKVPCNIVEQRKQIYVNEGNFNKFWFMISENICRGIYKHGRTDVTQTMMNEKVNLSLLESTSRTARINASFVIEYQGKEIDIETQRLISKRASALEDNRIRFVFAKNDNYVHDKTCEQVEKITYWNFDASEKLPMGRELCPRCRKRLLVRSAIKTDTKRFAWYIRFFEKGQTSSRILEKYLGGGKAELHMDVLDELKIKYNEDTWIIQMGADGLCSLRHNNYVMVGERERYITSGFHVQKHHPPYLPGILAYIDGYDWKKHLEVKKEIRPIVPIQVIEETTQEKEKRRTLWDIIKSVFLRKR